jgi:hypothetical protein
MTTTYGANTYLPSSPVVPPFLIITNITQGSPMVVTVSTTNAYIPGQMAYFSIPFDYGMFQLNGLSARVKSVDVTNLIFTMDFDSTLFDSFVTPSGGEQPASMASQGSRNTYNFVNLPFHSLNGGIGN